jgi:hypothetical protein
VAPPAADFAVQQSIRQRRIKTPAAAISQFDTADSARCRSLLLARGMTVIFPS